MHPERHFDDRERPGAGLRNREKRSWGVSVFASTKCEAKTEDHTNERTSDLDRNHRWTPINTDGCLLAPAGCAPGRFAPWREARLGAGELRFPGPGRSSHRRVGLLKVSINNNKINTDSERINTDYQCESVTNPCSSIIKRMINIKAMQTPAIERGWTDAGPQSRGRPVRVRAEAA